MWCHLNDIAHGMLILRKCFTTTVGAGKQLRCKLFPENGLWHAGESMEDFLWEKYSEAYGEARLDKAARHGRLPADLRRKDQLDFDYELGAQFPMTGEALAGEVMHSPGSQ